MEDVEFLVREERKSNGGQEGRAMIGRLKRAGAEAKLELGFY